jgi:uncharacterized phage infection (PIP) family protein YhgE
MTAAILVAGCAVGLAACSSGTGTGNANHTVAPGTASPAATPTHTGAATVSKATCKHVDSLRGSLDTLTHLQLNASSAGQIRTNLTNISTQLSELKGQGGSAFSHRVHQLSSSLNEVKKAAGNVSTPPSAAQVSQILTALSSLKAQSRTAVAEMNAVCPKG